MGGRALRFEDVDLVVCIDRPYLAAEVEGDTGTGLVEVLACEVGGEVRERLGELGGRGVAAAVGAVTPEGLGVAGDLRIRAVLRSLGAPVDPGVVEVPRVPARGVREPLQGVLEAEWVERGAADEERIERVSHEVKETAEEVAGDDSLVAVDLAEGDRVGAWSGHESTPDRGRS